MMLVGSSELRVLYDWFYDFYFQDTGKQFLK